MRECELERTVPPELQLIIKQIGGKRGRKPIPKLDKAKGSTPISTSASSNF